MKNWSAWAKDLLERIGGLSDLDCTDKEKQEAIEAHFEHLADVQAMFDMQWRPVIESREQVHIGLVELYRLLESKYPSYDEQVVNKVLQLLKDTAKP